MVCIWSIFQSRHATYKKVDVAGISTVAFRHVLGQLLSHFYPLILTTDCCVSEIQTIGSWRLWQVNRKCLLIIGTWSQLWYIQAPCLSCTHICSFLFCLITRLITVGYLCLFVFSKLSEILVIKYSQIYNSINIFFMWVLYV